MSDEIVDEFTGAIPTGWDITGVSLEWDVPPGWVNLESPLTDARWFECAAHGHRIYFPHGWTITITKMVCPDGCAFPSYIG